MITPTAEDLQILALAIGFLISGSFMRIVWKPAQNRVRARKTRRPGR
jgi:hypothetical protein